MMNLKWEGKPHYSYAFLGWKIVCILWIPLGNLPKVLGVSDWRILCENTSIILFFIFDWNGS